MSKQQTVGAAQKWREKKNARREREREEVRGTMERGRDRSFDNENIIRPFLLATAGKRTKIADR